MNLLLKFQVFFFICKVHCCSCVQVLTEQPDKENKAIRQRCLPHKLRGLLIKVLPSFVKWCHWAYGFHHHALEWRWSGGEWTVTHTHMHRHTHTHAHTPTHVYCGHDRPKPQAPMWNKFVNRPLFLHWAALWGNDSAQTFRLNSL